MRSVITSIEIHVPPHLVTNAFVEHEHLSQWWHVERSFIEPQPGGVYTLLWGLSGEGIKYISTGTIKFYKPGRLLHIDHYLYINPERQVLGPQDLVIDVKPVANGSLLTLSQGPYPEDVSEDWDWFYEVVADAWPQVVSGLKNYLEVQRNDASTQR